ncbi:MAG: hypothetical protein KAF42_11645 [Sphingopyxis terrae]|nr:hypothetical protein [Sphingopyxis terrae]
MNEETNRPSDVAEAALADTVANKVEAAYRLGKVREKLRVMMADWANYRDERKQGSRYTRARRHLLGQYERAVDRIDEKDRAIFLGQGVGELSFRELTKRHRAYQAS